MREKEGTHKDPKANINPKAIFFRNVKLRSFKTKAGRVMMTTSSKILKAAPA